MWFLCLIVVFLAFLVVFLAFLVVFLGVSDSAATLSTQQLYIENKRTLSQRGQHKMTRLSPSITYLLIKQLLFSRIDMLPGRPQHE